MMSQTVGSFDGLGDLVVEWLRSFNPFEDEGLYAGEIVEMYLVGSRAKGTARADSDCDVAVVFSREHCEGDLPTSLKLSELLHVRFGVQMPRWNDVDVDIQIFFSDDPELGEYAKIPLLLDVEIAALNAPEWCSNISF